MFNNQKIKSFQFLKKKRVILTIFLLFCVASSKGIIVYNEETLVALSFGLFVIFSYSYFGNTITESLDERSSTILNGLENFHRLKQEALVELLSLHKRSLYMEKLFAFIKQQYEELVSGTNHSFLQYQTPLKKKRGKKKISASLTKKPRSWKKKSSPLSSLELYNTFSEQIRQKLAVFQSSKAWLNQRLQNSIAFTIKDCVIEKIKNSKLDKKPGRVSKQVQLTLKLLAE